MSRIPSFVWIILVIVLGVGFLFLLNGKKNSDITATNQTLPVKVEVYVDYNCPHCADFEPFVKETEETYGDKVDIQVKNLPFLADSSVGYAYAAEAARKQGKFDEFSYDMFKWAVYQGILKNQRVESDQKYTYTDEDKEFYSQAVDPSALASKLGLDMDQYQIDVNGDEVKSIVKDQKAEVVKLTGTQSTPTVLIYGKVFSMANFDDLKTKVGDLITQIESQNK